MRRLYTSYITLNSHMQPLTAQCLLAFSFTPIGDAQFVVLAEGLSSSPIQTHR